MRALRPLAVLLLADAPRAGPRRQGWGGGASWSIRTSCGSAPIRTTCRSPDEAGEGFENKIAELLGQKLGKPVDYTYFPQVIGFFRNTLNAFRCDVVIGVAGRCLVQTTNPYYRTSYALMFQPDSGLDGVETLEDPRLKDKRIGIVAGTPPATVMARNGLMADANPIR